MCRNTETERKLEPGNVISGELGTQLGVHFDCKNELNFASFSTKNM